MFAINKKERYKAFTSKKDDRIKQMGGTIQFPDIDPHLKQQNEQTISRFLRESRKLSREDKKK